MKKNNMSMIYLKIDALRKRFNLSKKDFCDFLEISQDVYRRYMSGERFISSEILIKISEKFKISLDFLINSNFSVDDLELGFWLRESAGIDNEKLLDNLKLFVLLNKVNFLNVYSEKKVWEKLLFNPQEDFLRALSLILQNVKKEDFENVKKVKEKLIEVVEKYYDELSLTRKIISGILSSEKKYLIKYINTLSDEECLLIIANANLIIKEVSEKLSAPISRILLKLQEKKYKNIK